MSTRTPFGVVELAEARVLYYVAQMSVSALPSSLQEWKHPAEDSQGHLPWFHFSDFFAENGYFLYQRPSNDNLDLYPPNTAHRGFSYDPVTDVFRILAPATTAYPYNVWPARDREGRDYYMKVLHYGKRSECLEARILLKLSDEPLKSDPANPVVPLIVMLEHENWIFSVTARHGECDDPPFCRVHEGIDFGLQILQGVRWLHRNNIAHLDIAPENIVMNCLMLPTQGRRFLRSFPVKYRFIDVGCSRMYSQHEEPLADLYYGRDNKAPELTKKEPYNPFRADVYATGLMLLSTLYPLTEFTPGFLPLIRDMTRPNPAERITSEVAVRRFEELGISEHNQQLWRPFDTIPYLSVKDRDYDDALAADIRQFAEHERTKTKKGIEDMLESSFLTS